MYHFCTYFDRNYIAQGLTLYRSLSRNSGPFILWVLCFDDPTYDLLMQMGIDNLRPVPLRDLEQGDGPLRKTKTDRSRVEYIFTCTPSWPLYLLNVHPEIDMITYLDADLYFYSNPAPIFDEITDRSILIIGHRFPEHLRHLEIHGIYNVGLLTFRNDSRGRDCLQWWRERCLEWCFDRLEDGRYADQKYLDYWPERFPGVGVLQHKGAGLAPWNFMKYKIDIEKTGVTIDGQPLIFYHFHGFRLIYRLFYDPGTKLYGPMPSNLRRWLYDGYAKALFDTETWVRNEIHLLKLVAYRPVSRSYPWWRMILNLLQGQISMIPKK